MIKINALNEESEEDSNSEEVTREALEQIASQQYTKALDLQKKGNLQDATQLLKDLLNTELLFEVKKPIPGEKAAGPLFNLKYLCYKNLAVMLSNAGDLDAAIDAYFSAADLDETDVTLWYRLGKLCLQTKKYEMALQSFQQGIKYNPRHWPCIDNIVTLLLGLGFKEECIIMIYDAFKLDPDYLRGLVYREHIYCEYPYVKDYMVYLNPMYNSMPEGLTGSEKANKLLKEASDIWSYFKDQQSLEHSQYLPNKLPILKLKRPVSALNWISVGDSLVHMHEFMTEECFSHACKIEFLYQKKEIIQTVNELDEAKNTDFGDKANENLIDSDKNTDIVSEHENDVSEKDKTRTDHEKIESDIEMLTVDPVIEIVEDMPEQNKTQKKVPVRRRGSALSFLQQWEWCNRRPGRKKPANLQEDDDIRHILWKLIPVNLTEEYIKNKEKQERVNSPVADVVEKVKKLEAQTVQEYFGTEDEQNDVQQFINRYKDGKYDIIDILKDYLGFLMLKWNIVWPETLLDQYAKANGCYKCHIDDPPFTDDNKEELLFFIRVNLIAEEYCVNNKINKSATDAQLRHELGVLETISLALTLKPYLFEKSDWLQFTLRYLWIKLHVHILNKCDDSALDSLYQLLNEIEHTENSCDVYCNTKNELCVINFTFKPVINESEIKAYIEFLERNKKLVTVMDLFDQGNFEEVLIIVIDSFDHCKYMSKKQGDEMSLDFAIQLCLILDAYWALEKVEECFKWSFICLNEALKHYFRFTSDLPNHEKWTRCVVKILCYIEHILKTEGLLVLGSIPRDQLCQGLDDVIRIIGHQVEKNSSDMPFDCVTPWIILHYILQREEDQGRHRFNDGKERNSSDDIPNSLMVLFLGHEQLGEKSWCCKNDGKLLYFILDTICPRLRSPSLLKCLEQICQHMEQCVYCLFGHPARKNKLKNLVDHNVTPCSMDWERAQYVYEIFRPPSLPALVGKMSGIIIDTEQLFHRILQLLPPECDPSKHLSGVEKYIRGLEQNLPPVPVQLPFKMRDIYFLLGDHYFKKEDYKMAIKYNMIDVVINPNRLESWAEISLSKAVNLDRILNSCKNLNNDREFLNPAKCVIRCYKRALELDPSNCTVLIEYGMFVYTVHSFCSRVLKQASESLSMEDFEALERQKEEMLDTTYKCFTTVMSDFNNSSEADGEKEEDSWLHYYMLGKVAEKRNKPPSVYLNFYIKGVKSLQETSATYPLKINYSSPTHLCIEVLELHYRIHASILKYIEQHENKPIPALVGKVFLKSIEEWKNGPFVKDPGKEGTTETETDNKVNEPVHAANILKRSISDAGEEDTLEAKRMKLESAAAKIRRSASYDTEVVISKESAVSNLVSIDKQNKNDCTSEQNKNDASFTEVDRKGELNNSTSRPVVNSSQKVHEHESESKESSSSTTSSSSSESSSSSSSSTSSSDSSSEESKSSNKCNSDLKPISDNELMKIISACLDALEDCASRFPPHYKAIYRLAHYHFYYKKGKDIERCRDLMLSTFTSRAGQKLGGLFSERKLSNFFNNIWKIPLSEVERPGGFAFHMNRCVLLTMEILKEIDDHKTLLDLSLHLQRIPDLDKKYLRDSDREELSQQAYSLCVQSLKGQLLKFSQQADLKSNEVEQQAFKCLLLDIYRANNRAQKQLNCKQLTNLLVDGYKLLHNVSDTTNLVDISMKYCYSLTQTLKQQATLASIDKNQNSQKKQIAKAITESTKLANTVTSSQSNTENKLPSSNTLTSLQKMTTHEMAYQSCLSMLNSPVNTLSYLSTLNNLANYSSFQSSLQNSFQAEFYRQFLGQSFPYLQPPPKKQQKRGPKPAKSVPLSTGTAKPSKSYTSTGSSSAKGTPASVISSMQKSISAPSMGSVLPTLPASMSNLSSFGTHITSSTHSIPTQAHASTANTLNAAIQTKPPLPHQQVSPGKTLQEKLAERQKIIPKSSSHDITASLCKLPSSLTITKSSVSKPANQIKNVEAKKSLPFEDGDIIVLDDD